MPTTRQLVIILLLAACLICRAADAPPSAPATAPASQPADAPVAPADWPLVRADPQNTGVAGTRLPANLHPLWRFELGDATTCTAAISGGAVYIGADSGRFVALDLETGQLRWESRTGSAIESAPTVVPPVPQPQSKPADTRPATASSQPGSAPDGLVVFGDDDGILHALGIKDGTPRWAFKTGDKVVSSANRKGERLVFGSYDGNIYCLHAADGSLVWKYALGERVHGTPGITGDFVVAAACDAHLHVIRLADGSLVRTIALGSVSGSAAALVGDRVIIGTYGNQVLGINWQSDDVAWRFEDKDHGFPFLSSAAVTDNVAIIGGRDKRLRAFDTRTGQVRWQFTAKGRLDSSPVLVGDRVFVGSADGNLYAIDQAAGREVWRFEAGGAISASPAIGEGRLVIGTEEGVVYGFGGERASR